MTLTTYTRCDWCGEEILDGDRKMELEWHGTRCAPDHPLGRERVVAEDVAHYHAGEGRDCYPRVRDMLSLILEAAPSFEQVPTASADTIAGLRRRHHPEETDR